MTIYLKSFTRTKAVFCLYDDQKNEIAQTHTVIGDFSPFAHDAENTNDFRLKSNGVDAEQIEEWIYPVPAYQHRMTKIEKAIIERFNPFN